MRPRAGAPKPTVAGSPLAAPFKITLLGGFTPTTGNRFQIFNACSFGGSFAQLELPALTQGMSRDLDLLLSGGCPRVIGSAISEPASSATLSALAALGLGATRRRRLRR